MLAKESRMRVHPKGDNSVCCLNNLPSQTQVRALKLHQVQPTFASANDSARIQQIIFIRGADSANHGDSG